MKTSMKFIFLTLSLFVVIGVSAQSPITYGIKGGVNLSEYTSFGGEKAKAGFNLGVTIDYNFAPNLYIMSGLELTNKGSKINKDYLPYYGYNGDIGLGYPEIPYIKGKMNAMYLQVPIHLGYKVQIAPTTKLVFFAGPYLSYGIGGKTTITEAAKGYAEVGEHDLFGENGARRFDIGLGGGVGVEFGKIAINLGYDHGLQNVWKGSGIKNKNAYLSVGYKF